MTKNSWHLRLCISLCVLLFVSAIPGMGQAAAGDKAIASLTADVGGLKLHYLKAGHGPTSDPAARLYANVAHVEADHSTSCRKIYGDCA